MRSFENPVDKLVDLADKLPLEVLVDVKTRMGDWVLAGGKIDDPYMWQQAEFANKVVKKIEMRNKNGITNS